MQFDPTMTLKLPQGHTFTDLKVRRCDADSIDLDMDLVKTVCTLNGLDFEKVCTNPGPVVSAILSVWYKSHLELGGAPDPVMESFRPQDQTGANHPVH